jgi:Zn-dependent protease
MLAGRMMNEAEFLQRLLILPPLILSLSVHEWAHAYSAYRLGDDTAAHQGRLTLNPLSHIDPIGTLLLPMLGIPFGWAKPVPVNPVRFTRRMSMSTGMLITAAAGPFSNVVLAVIAVFAMSLFAPLLIQHESLWLLLAQMLRMNIALAIFNMLPIPPLDGSRVADGLMPLRLRGVWERFAQYGPLFLLGLIFFGLGPMRYAIAWAESALLRMALF